MGHLARLACRSTSCGVIIECAVIGRPCSRANANSAFHTSCENSTPRAAIPRSIRPGSENCSSRKRRMSSSRLSRSRRRMSAETAVRRRSVREAAAHAGLAQRLQGRPSVLWGLDVVLPGVDRGDPAVDSLGHPEANARVVVLRRERRAIGEHVRDEVRGQVAIAGASAQDRAPAMPVRCRRDPASRSCRPRRSPSTIAHQRRPISEMC